MVGWGRAADAGPRSAALKVSSLPRDGRVDRSDRSGWLAPVLGNYLAHAWMAVVALVWFFVFRRRFPIGSIREPMRPWYVAAFVLIAVSVAETLTTTSPPRLHL